MATLVFALLVLGLFGWMLKARRTAAIAAVFLLFSLITRTAALIYVDLGGPMYSDQLEFFVGGGSSMPLFASSVLVFLVPLAFLFRPAAMRKGLQVARPKRLYNPVVVSGLLLNGIVLFLAATYADMLMRGPVPLLVGMDRLEYNNNIAGPLHDVLNDHGFAIAFLLGLSFVMPRLAGGDFRPKAFAVYLLVLVYHALTGNRFSAFYAFTSFFVIPLAAVASRSASGRLAPAPAQRSGLIAFLVSPSARVLVLMVGAAGLIGLLINSVVNVRAYDDPANLFFQRIVVQPVELWWATFAELDTQPPNSLEAAWNALFVDPIDPTRNTSVRLLMINSLGFDRALELAEFGTQFAGGYPEIFFELLGTWFALPAALVFGIVTAWLLRIVVRATSLGRLGSATCGVYVFYGFTLLYIGGMLNFLLVWTYWVKCAALLIFMLLERRQAVLVQRPTAKAARARSPIMPRQLPGNSPAQG